MNVGGEHGDVEPEPERPARWWRLVLGCVVGAFVVLGAYALVTGATGSNGGASASSTIRPAAAHDPASSLSASAPATPTLNRPASPADSPAQRTLKAAAVTAFGPAGTSDGDNPGIASRVLGGGAQPWYSSWYATAKFGNLQAGTGLLLDMGEAVTVSSVHLVLGSPLGAAVQVRVGNATNLPALSPVATATDVGGTVQLTTAAKASGRYVLIWFTELPPNGLGKFQVNVYSATVKGTAAA